MSKRDNGSTNLELIRETNQDAYTQLAVVVQTFCRIFVMMLDESISQYNREEKLEGFEIRLMVWEKNSKFWEL
jgi:hypothetical protein